MSKLVELCHVIEDGMLTYPGLPGPKIGDHLGREDARQHYAAGTSFQIGKIEMVANTGTYVDAPFHRYAEGKDLSQLDISCFADLSGLVLHADRGNRVIDETAFRAHDVRAKAVLVHTGWDKHWRTDHYFENHPFLTRGAAEFLKNGGAALVGIDSLNIDDTADGNRPVHSILLGAGIPIVEHMCGLDRLPDSGFRFFAVPPAVRGMGSFPVRAFAIVDK